MEAKLKGMKVADLKAVLQQANVTFDSKLTKPALIKKIMETPEAAAIASAPDEAVAADDDMPDLPPTLNWDDGPKLSGGTTQAPVTKPVPPTTINNPVAKTSPTKEPPPTPATGVPAAAPNPTDGLPPSGETSKTLSLAEIPTISMEDEVAKRRARAAKWGTPYVEPIAQTAKKSTSPRAANEAEEKRKAREARFGAAKPAASAPVDDEEARKRKAREERFGPNKKPRLSPAPAS